MTNEQLQTVREALESNTPYMGGRTHIVNKALAILDSAQSGAKDAERYRWLLNGHLVSWKQDYSPPYTTIRPFGDFNVDGHYDTVSAAIDAAIAAQKGGDQAATWCDCHHPDCPTCNHKNKP